MTQEPRRDPELKPDVPSYAEKMDILPHIRHQFHPMFLNAAGGPDIYGPKRYLGIDIRCPVCRDIHPLGPPGVDNECPKCHFMFKYTAAKGNCFLWMWKKQEVIVLSEKPIEFLSPVESAQENIKVIEALKADIQEVTGIKPLRKLW